MAESERVKGHLQHPRCNYVTTAYIVSAPLSMLATEIMIIVTRRTENGERRTEFGAVVSVLLLGTWPFQYDLTAIVPGSFMVP